MVIYLEKKMERLNSGDEKIIFGTILSTLNIDWSDEATWQEEEEARKDFNILLTYQDKKFLSPSSSKSFRTQSHWSFSTGQMYWFRTILRQHLTHWMCNQITLHHKLRIDTGKQIWAKENRQYSLRLWIRWTRNTKIHVTIDLEAPRLARYMHKAWKKQKKHCVLGRNKTCSTERI